MQRFVLRVGANNVTGELERDAAEAIIDRYFDAFTSFETRGTWRGNRERSLVIEILTADREKVLWAARALQTSLGQDAVLVESNDTRTVLLQQDDAVAVGGVR